LGVGFNELLTAFNKLDANTTVRNNENAPINAPANNAPNVKLKPRLKASLGPARNPVILPTIIKITARNITPSL